MVCHQGAARPPPEHPAVAGNVQDLQAQAPGEGGERRLVPGYVGDGRAKSFRHRHNPHRGCGEGEEGAVLLQDEEREFVPPGLRQQRPDESEAHIGCPPPICLSG